MQLAVLDCVRRTHSRGRVAGLDQFANKDWHLEVAKWWYGVTEERHPTPSSLNKSNSVELLFTSRRAAPSRGAEGQPDLQFVLRF